MESLTGRKTSAFQRSSWNMDPWVFWTYSWPI